VLAYPSCLTLRCVSHSSPCLLKELQLGALLVVDTTNCSVVVVLDSLLVIEPVISAVVPNLMKSGREGVEESDSQLVAVSGL
jgi:hypothetical protein